MYNVPVVEEELGEFIGYKFKNGGKQAKVLLSS